MTTDRAPTSAAFPIDTSASLITMFSTVWHVVSHKRPIDAPSATFNRSNSNAFPWTHALAPTQAPMAR